MSIQSRKYGLIGNFQEMRVMCSSNTSVPTVKYYKIDRRLRVVVLDNLQVFNYTMILKIIAYTVVLGEVQSLLFTNEGVVLVDNSELLNRIFIERELDMEKGFRFGSFVTVDGIGIANNSDSIQSTMTNYLDGNKQYVYQLITSNVNTQAKVVRCLFGDDVLHEFTHPTETMCIVHYVTKDNQSLIGWFVSNDFANLNRFLLKTASQDIYKLDNLRLTSYLQNAYGCLCYTHQDGRKINHYIMQDNIVQEVISNNAFV